MNEQVCGQVKQLPRNHFAWGIALFPYAIFMVNCVLVLKGISTSALVSVSTLVSYSLSILLWLLDRLELERSGYTIGKWKYWILLLPVVYLLVRAAKTDKKYGSAIVSLVYNLVSILLISLSLLLTIFMPYI